MKTSHYRVGISGWNYPRWRKTFYPADLPQRRELEYASHHLTSIEINGTFYSLQTLKSYQRWYNETPTNFVFSIKGPRYITHIRRLREVEGSVANFFASGVLALKEKLGPILWQLPPSFRYDYERLKNFFELLPKTTTAAARMAKRTDSYFKHEPYTHSGRHRKLKYALEVRHESFIENQKEFIELLKQYNIALVCADAAAKWPYFETRTADFAYARLHGGSILYTSRYTPRQLKHWAKLAKAWKGKSRDVFIYFDNDAKVYAPKNAQELQELLH